VSAERANAAAAGSTLALTASRSETFPTAMGVAERRAQTQESPQKEKQL